MVLKFDGDKKVVILQVVKHTDEKLKSRISYQLHDNTITNNNRFYGLIHKDFMNFCVNMIGQ